MLAVRAQGVLTDDAEASGTGRWGAAESGRALPLVLPQAPFAVVEGGLQLVLR